MILSFSSLHVRGQYHAALVDPIHFRPQAALHRHDFYEVFLILEGGCEHDLVDKTESLRKGDLRLIRPELTHRFLVHKSESVRFINIALPAETAMLLAQLMPRSPLMGSWLKPEGKSSYHFSGKDLLHIRRLFEECLLHVDQPNNGRHLLNLFAGLDEVVSLSESTSAPAWLQEAVESVRTPRGLREGIKVLRATAQVSDAYLSRIVQKCYQTTPSSLVAQIRVEAAMELLRRTDLSVEAVCNQVGFGSIGDFHRRFAASTGLTPAEFRFKARKTILM